MHLRGGGRCARRIRLDEDRRRQRGGQPGVLSSRTARAAAGPAPWSEAGTPFLTATEPGILLLCSDGLWNYLPDADDLARICAGHDAATAATALVDYALAAGGQDNITVAVLSIGDLP